MADQHKALPWVSEHQTHIGFALQVFPYETRSNPSHALLAAEQLGFDTFFFSDLPAWSLDPWLHMAVLAIRTERIRLGTNVVCAAYRHPVMLARLVADLDNLSSGRVILGLGSGWDTNEFANFGLPFPPIRERQQALDETITILRGCGARSLLPFMDGISKPPEPRLLRHPSSGRGLR